MALSVEIKTIPDSSVIDYKGGYRNSSLNKIREALYLKKEKVPMRIIGEMLYTTAQNASLKLSAFQKKHKVYVLSPQMIHRALMCESLKINTKEWDTAVSDGDRIPDWYKPEKNHA